MTSTPYNENDFDYLAQQITQGVVNALQGQGQQQGINHVAEGIDKLNKQYKKNQKALESFAESINRRYEGSKKARDKAEAQREDRKQTRYKGNEKNKRKKIPINSKLTIVIEAPCKQVIGESENRSHSKHIEPSRKKK